MQQPYGSQPFGDRPHGRPSFGDQQRGYPSFRAPGPMRPEPFPPGPRQGWGSPAPQQFPPPGQPGFYGVPGAVPPSNGPTQAIPVVPDYQRPVWGDSWQQPPRASRSGLLAGTLALLVAALVTGVVILTQGSDSQQAVQPGSGGQTQLPPKPPPTTDRTSIDPITTSPETSAGPATTSRPTTTSAETTTSQPTTSRPTTTSPRTTTSRPTTSRPTTTSPRTTTSRPTTSRPTKPTTDSRAKDRRAAEQAASGWAAAVTRGDAEGVRALSCDQDLQTYDSGDLQNPAGLAGRFTLTFDRVIVSPPYGVAYFSIAPDVDGETTLKSFVTATDGTWKVCMTVTDPADL